MTASPQPPARDETWLPPVPLGYPASIQALGGFAAPLLAATSFTLTALLMPMLTAGTKQFSRWPEAALTCFLAAGLMQIAAVQATVWARRYDTSPSELAQWWPGEVPDGTPTAWLRNVQRSHLELGERWANRTRRLYHAGILLLLAGTVAMVVPPGPLTAVRAPLVGTAVFGLAGEVLWLVGAAFVGSQRQRLAVLCAAYCLLAAVSGGLILTGPSWLHLVVAGALPMVRKPLRRRAEMRAAAACSIVLAISNFAGTIDAGWAVDVAWTTAVLAFMVAVGLLVYLACAERSGG